MSGHPSGPSTSSSRARVELIVQRSTIELFGAYQVAVAPVDHGRRRSSGRPADHLAGTVHVAVANRRGVLTLSTSNPMLTRMRSLANDASARQDWIRELTNQLAGRIKTKLARYQVAMQVSLPTALKGLVVEREASGTQPALSYAFHALRDEVYVTLTGGFEHIDIALGAEVSIPEEGDVILF